MANRFWVGGAGTWDTTSTANWSATTGGAAGASAPGVADTAIFNANSGNGYTVTLGADIEVQAVTANQAANWTLDFVNYKITLNGNNFIVWRSAAVEYLGTPVVDLTYAGAVGTRNITPGAATVVTNPPTFNIVAGTDIVSLTYTSGLKYNTVNFTGFSGTWAIGASSNLNILGDLILSSGMTVGSGAGVLIFSKQSGTQSITTLGKTIDCPITIGAAGTTNTVQLQDDLTMGSTRTLNLTAGTLDLSSGNRTLSCGLFSSANSNTRAIAFGTGQIDVTGNNATIWNLGTSTNFSYTGTPTVNCTYSESTGTRSIAAGAVLTGGTENTALNFNISAGSDIVQLSLDGTTRVYKNIDFTGFSGTLTNRLASIYGNVVFSSGMTVGAGASTTTFAATSGTQQITTNSQTIDFPLNFNGIGGTFAFQDTLTQGSTRAFTIVNGTVQLKNGVTSTVGSFVANNSNVKFLQSTTPGSQATLSQASGTVNVVDLTIRDINAIGGASWNAYTDFENTDAGNNDGWNFSLSPPYSTAELPVTLRPFTQPRRF